jgi:hypothetical protein
MGAIGMLPPPMPDAKGQSAVVDCEHIEHASTRHAQGAWRRYARAGDGAGPVALQPGK